MSDARRHDTEAILQTVSPRYLDVLTRIDELIPELRNLAAVVRTAMEQAQEPGVTVETLRPYAQWAEQVREYLEAARKIPDKTWRQMENPEAWLKDQEPEQ